MSLSAASGITGLSCEFGLDAHPAARPHARQTIGVGSRGGLPGDRSAALLLLTVLFSADPEPTWAQVAYVAALGAAAVVGAIALRRAWRSAWLRRNLLATDQTTSQLRVRGAFVILLTFAATAHEFGVNALLGAFIGGVVLNIADSDDRPTQERYRGKLSAIGYGFLVPVFFIATGACPAARARRRHSCRIESFHQQGG